MRARRAGVAVLLGLMLRPPTPAAQTPAFEVASVKPSPRGGSTQAGAFPMVMPIIGGRFTATNVPLRMLVGFAYEAEDERIIGGPSWQRLKTFDITAKADPAVLRTPEDLAPLLKTLLADRFKLKVRTETRELPVHVLVVARRDRQLGPDLKPSVSGRPISVLVNLAAKSTGRIVKDETGLSGLYDWELHFDPASLLGPAGRLALPAGMPRPQSDAPPLVAALREQLGLTLESARRHLEVVVIESADLPSPD